jgi:hypothetical protein
MMLCSMFDISDLARCVGSFCSVAELSRMAQVSWGCRERYSGVLLSRRQWAWSDLARLEGTERLSVRSLLIDDWATMSSNFASQVPASVRDLTLVSSCGWHVQLAGVPPWLTHLTLPSSFNQPLGHDWLPGDLVSLDLGVDFNQPIGRQQLPPGLRRLKMGKRFNQVLDTHCLPAQLTHLSFGRRFNQPLPDLPANLRQLTLGPDYSHSLPPVPTCCVILHHN